MKILIIGSGGREHAIAQCLLRSKHNVSLFFAPGNAGTNLHGKNLEIKDTDINGLINAAIDNQIDFTIVGPEAPLVDGIVDEFNLKNLSIIGPSKIAAQLEGSKQWAKDLMKRHNIPTAKYEVFEDYSKAVSYVNKVESFPIVVKADGLAAGKGVTVATTKELALEALEKCFVNKEFSDAGLKVVIEDFLEGEEASIFAFTDGKTILPMLPAQDHKAVFEGDKGPNTGGMGAYCPADLVDNSLQETVQNEVFTPLLKAFQKENISYKGIVYAGLMISSEKKVSIVEFNVRFGDPETQVVLPLLETDLVDICIAILEEKLNEVDLNWSKDYSACVVLASGGYPGSYEKGKPILGLSDTTQDVSIIHAGTKISSNQVITNGGRVLGVVANCSNLGNALKKVYTAINSISFENMYYRKDIGFKALK